MKKIHLTLLAALLSSMTAFGQQTDQISGSFPCKAKYPSGNAYLMDSCRVNYTYKTVLGAPGYLANVVWYSRNEFTVNGKRVTSEDVKDYPDLAMRFSHIAPTKADFKFTVMFYSEKLHAYIASAKASMSVPYVEVAGANYAPQILTTGIWRNMFTDVVIGKQDINKPGVIISDATIDSWFKTNDIRTGKLDPNPQIRHFGSSLRGVFNNSTRIDIVNQEVSLEWPVESCNYIINELNRIGRLSACLAKNDTTGAADIYFSNRSSIPVVKTTSLDFWKTTVPPYDLTLSYEKSAEDFYKKGDYNNASIYFQKVLTLDSTIQYAQARLAKIKLYQDYKNTRSVGGLDLVYVEGNSSVKSFYIGKTEITQNQWRRVMGGAMPECRNCPVSNITWQQATEFVKKLSAQTGLKYRLPRVDEWAYAAQGGKKNTSETQFSGSDNIDEVAWTVYNSEENIHPVAQKSPNELGIYDMTGNVSEWTNNIFDKQTRIAKGGSWTDDAANCAISLDQKLDVNYKSKSIGFRVCQDE